MKKTNWFTGCDTFWKLTAAFEDQLSHISDPVNVDSIRHASQLINITIRQYIMILDSNFEITRKNT